MRLNHLHLHVRDIARTRAFYERWLDFRYLTQHGEIVFLRDAGGLDLALAPDPAPDPMPAWFHVGTRLSSGEDVQTLCEQMQDAGVPILRPVEHMDDFAVFRCADPDGVTVEVYWEPDPAAPAPAPDREVG